MDAFNRHPQSKTISLQKSTFFCKPAGFLNTEMQWRHDGNAEQSAVEQKLIERRVLLSILGRRRKNMLYFNYFRVHIKKRNIKSNPFKNSHNSLPTSLILSLNISQITSSSSQMKTKKEESHFTQFYCPPGDKFTTRMGLRFRGVPDDQVKESLRKKGKGQTNKKNQQILY